MKYTVLLLLFFCFIKISSAQIAYEPGYFIDNQGEKTTCLIRDRGWKNNPSSITYRLSGDAPEITLESQDIKEFGIGERLRYSKQRVAIETSSDKIVNLSSSPELNLLDTVVLLKHEVDGQASLFSFSSKYLPNRYFYQIDGDSIKPLIYRLHTPDGVKIIKNAMYKEQLSQVMHWEGNEKDIRRLSYNLRVLRNFFIRYNQYQENNYSIFNKDQQQARFTVMPNVGMEYAAIDVSNRTAGMRGAFPGKVLPRVGLELEYIIPYFKNQWSLFTNPSFVSYRGSINTFPAMEIQYNSIDIPVGLRKYFFMRNHSAVHINVFTAFNFDIDSHLKTINTSIETGSSMNFGGAVGYTWKGRYVAEFKYNLPKNITTDYLFWNTQYQSTSLTFGYRFGGR